MTHEEVFVFTFSTLCVCAAVDSRHARSIFRANIG